MVPDRPEVGKESYLQYRRPQFGFLGWEDSRSRDMRPTPGCWFPLWLIGKEPACTGRLDLIPKEDPRDEATHSSILVQENSMDCIVHGLQRIMGLLYASLSLFT